MHSNAIYGNGGQTKRIGWEEWSRGVFKQLKKCWRVLLCTQACGHCALSWPRVRPDWMRWLVGFIRKTTVRLLTHVLCKPIHFFFHSFIATHQRIQSGLTRGQENARWPHACIHNTTLQQFFNGLNTPLPHSSHPILFACPPLPYMALICIVMLYYEVDKSIRCLRIYTPC